MRRAPRPPHQQDNQTLTIPAEDVLHIQGLGYDGIKGYSVIQYAAESIGVGLAAQGYNAAFLANDATPSGAITIPETISEDSVKVLRTSSEEQRKSMENKHRFAVLHGGM